MGPLPSFRLSTDGAGFARDGAEVSTAQNRPKARDDRPRNRGDVARPRRWKFDGRESTRRGLRSHNQDTRNAPFPPSPRGPKTGFRELHCVDAFQNLRNDGSLRIARQPRTFQNLSTRGFFDFGGLQTLDITPEIATMERVAKREKTVNPRFPAGDRSGSSKAMFAGRKPPAANRERVGGSRAGARSTKVALKATTGTPKEPRDVWDLGRRSPPPRRFAISAPKARIFSVATRARAWILRKPRGPAPGESNCRSGLVISELGARRLTARRLGRAAARRLVEDRCRRVESLEGALEP